MSISLTYSSYLPYNNKLIYNVLMLMISNFKSDQGRCNMGTRFKYEKRPRLRPFVSSGGLSHVLGDADIVLAGAFYLVHQAVGETDRLIDICFGRFEDGDSHAEADRPSFIRHVLH